MHQSIKTKVKNRIIDRGPGWCFTLTHFLDLGKDASIRKALSQLEKQKLIRRLARGVYEYPKKHALLGIIPPDVNEVVKAIAEKMECSCNRMEPMQQIYSAFLCKFLGRLYF